MQGITITELVIGFDTSGSVFGGDEMTRFVSELRTIIEQVKPGKVHVIYWDTEVAGHQTFEDGQFAVQDLKIKGGGGTDGRICLPRPSCSSPTGMSGTGDAPPSRPCGL